VGAGAKLRRDRGQRPSRDRPHRSTGARRGPGRGDDRVSDARPLARTIEALLFLSPDPVAVEQLADAAQAGEEAVRDALELLGEQYAPGVRGIRLREVGGGFTLTSDPDAEVAARRLFSRARLSPLSPAQAETLAIVAYLQPV